MAQHHCELLAAARLLLARTPAQRGRLSSARIRRSMSTAYYAIFQFAQDECALSLVGSGRGLLRRRRIFIRELAHTGLRVAMEKVAAAVPARDVADFLLPGASRPRVPAFASGFAATFLEAQRQRHVADYDLNAPMGELDTQRMIGDVEAAIAAWQAATAPADRDFKHALCLLMTLGGKLRNG